MKSTKTLLIAALAVSGLMACGSVRAQDSTTTTNAPAMGSASPSTNTMPRGMRGTPNIDRMVQRLGLSDDQKSQVEPVLTQEYQKIRAVFQNTSLSRDEKIAQIRDIRKSTSEQMKSILTPDQYDKWSSSQMRRRRPAPFSQPGTTTTNAPSSSTQ